MQTRADQNSAGTASSSPPPPTLRQPLLERPLAMRLAREAYDRFAAQLRDLPPQMWSRPTCCAGWDVHAMACHVLGMAEMAASPVEAIRQLRRAGAAVRAGGLFIDALTERQVTKHRHRSADDILDRIARIGPKATRGRRLTPAVIRRRTLADQSVDERGDLTESWTVGYLLDVILTRDTWMHRLDIAEAAGVEPLLSPDHDGVLVADIAAEWAARHARPCILTLTGPAGGHWEWGTGGPTLSRDAVDFCRAVSGRAAGEGLLATRVPF